MGKFQDLTGLKFGKLTVIERAENSPIGHTRWDCRCECGNETIVSSSDLKSGNTKSCGCLKKKNNFKHGDIKSKEYNAWTGAKQRCFNKKDPSYKNYGGRGITMCSRWANDYTKFLKDMGRCPDGYTLDRIDNDGNYEPDNCRWASRKTQSQNTRTNRYIEYDGKRMVLAGWASKIGIRPNDLHQKLKTMSLGEIIAQSSPGQ